MAFVMYDKSRPKKIPREKTFLRAERSGIKIRFMES
jgi:hypothetical protein